MPDKEFDVEAAAATISSQDLGLGESEEPVVDAPETPESPEVAAPVVETPPVVRAVPKTWAKEKHELWGKIPPEAQEQIELREKQMFEGIEQYKEFSGLGKELNEVILPYRPIIDAQGLTPAKAVHTLLSAHYRLTQGSPEQRMAAYQQLGASLGLVQQPQVDPALRAYEDRLNRIESSMTQRERQQLQEKEIHVSSQVTAFAADHPYFDEVADDICIFIGAGASLQDAYEKAVYANPVTRQKEIARLATENEQKLREKAKAEAEAARKAISTNVRDRNTRKAPTEPLGTMEDTMRATLAEIKSRTH